MLKLGTHSSIVYQNIRTEANALLGRCGKIQYYINYRYIFLKTQIHGPHKLSCQSCYKTLSHICSTRATKLSLTHPMFAGLQQQLC
jgi:hypothetical protein